MLDTVLYNPWVRALGALLVLLVVAGIVYLLLPILVSLMLSFLVAYILMPLVHYGEKIRIPRMVTIIVLLSIIVITALSMPLYLAANVIQETDSFITRAQEGFTEERLDALIKMLPLRDLVIYLEWVPRGQQDFNEYAIIIERIGLTIEENALELIQNYGMQVANVGSQAGVSAAQFIKSVGAWFFRMISFMVNLGLFLFITAYLLRDYDAFMSNVHEIVPPRYRTTIDEFAHKIDHQLQALLRGQITVCFCLAVMYAIGLSIAGAPFAIPIAVFGGIVSLVPYIGPTATLTPAALFTLLYYGFSGHLLGVFIVIGAIQTVEGYVLTPRVIGGKIGLNPVWVIVAFMVFSSAFGLIGAVLALPLAAVLKVIIMETAKVYRNSAFFTEGTSTSSSDSS